jgi:hypothetical protein
MRDQLGWEAGYRFTIALDDRFDPDSDEVIFRPGAEVVALVPDTGLDREQRKKAPPGTKLWGRVYVDPQDEMAKGRGEPAAILVKYERAKLPGREEVPVCVIGRGAKAYTMDKDGATKAANNGEARATPFYPY